MMVPPGWTYDRDAWTGEGLWWHDDCGVVGWGGIGEEQLDRHGHLVAVLCIDCEACFDVTRRPAGVAA